MNNYSYRVAWSDDDNCYIATSPEFPSLSAWGDTQQEAIQEFGVVLEASIEIYQEKGWELPQPQKIQAYSGQFRLRLPKSLHARLAEQAAQEGISLNTLAVQYLAESLEGSNTRSWIRQELRQAATWFFGVIARGVFVAGRSSGSANFTQPTELKGEHRQISSNQSTDSETFDLVPDPVRYH